MNPEEKDHAFEARLRALPARPLPPPVGAAVLAAAHQALGQARLSSAPRLRPPRWLVGVWAGGLAAALALHLDTPAPPARPAVSAATASAAGPLLPALEQRLHSLSLFASHSSSPLSDLP